jgi:hypothetical protein
METVPGENQSMHDAAKQMSRFGALEANSDEYNESLLLGSSRVIFVFNVAIQQRFIFLPIGDCRSHDAIE